MRFGEYLSNNLTPEWSSQYIDYDEMKKILGELVIEASRSIDINDATAREEFFLHADEKFFQVG